MAHGSTAEAPAGPVKPRLRLGSAVMLVFALLSLPPLFFVLIYGQRRNEAAIVASLDRQLHVTQVQSVEAVSNLVGAVGKVLAVVGHVVASDPAYFRTEDSYGLLWQGLVSADQIDAVYVSFENGYHRVVTRLDDDRRGANPLIPQAANWHASYVDDFSTGSLRSRHRRFSAEWPTFLGPGFSVPTTFDVRTTAHYVAAKQTHHLAVGDPYINPETGAPVMGIGWPVMRRGQFIGFVGAGMTLNVVSAYLRDHRVSAHSVTCIIDQEGRVIAHPDPTAGLQVVAGQKVFKRVHELTDRRLVEAMAYRQRARMAPVRFVASTGDELSVASAPFPTAFGKQWEIMIVAPTDDFVGDLKATNRAVSTIIMLLILSELVLIYFLARNLSRHIETISNRFQAIRALDFVDSPAEPSRIGEIAELQNGFRLLVNALGSFAKFVPLGVVRQFVSSGHAIVPGVEAKVVTIFFCDLEGFSSRSETMQPDDLLDQLTEYFSAITTAIAQEGGTIDKFIGDAVMALWGAPTSSEDHSLRACAAAVRAKRRMEDLCQSWMAEGRPVMRMRIGLHTAEVLVGNIGSVERLSYTAIGDGVNVASRLEGVNKLFGTTICISDSIQEALGDQIVARPLRTLTVKGRSQDIMVSELLGLSGQDDPEVAARPDEIAIATRSAVAVSRRLLGDVAGCITEYRAILDDHPGDSTTQLLLDEVLTEGRHQQAPSPS